jgi:hypothetical protein
MIDRDMLNMAREAKRQRDEEGVVDERSDAVLALYEMGITGFAGLDPIAILADPAAFGHKIKVNAIVEGGDDGVFRGRRGGEPASNQFGTFAVHTASPKQIAFVKRLLAERDLGTIKVPADVDTISKKSASALIDQLMGRPVKSGATAPTGSQASDKQMAFLRSLISQRDYYSLVEADRRKVDWINSSDDHRPTSKGASELIETLKGTSYAPKSEQPKSVDLEMGMYRKADGTMYRVYQGRESGRMLAKRLVPDGNDGWEFEYAGMAPRFVTADERMSLDEAKAWGAQFGTCCVCAALLTDPESVARGIGPVCGSRV